jgi:phosphopantetheinyl transferase (holo-ACP synthase)
MAITLSTWSFETSSRLLGVGVDSEKVHRFDNLQEDGEHPLPFVFSKKEVVHNRTLKRPSAGFCMCFCCKEAVLKAIGAPYNFSECEIFPPQEKEHTFSPIEISMSEQLKYDYGIDTGVCVCDENSLNDEEIIAVVYLFRDR